jgi:hypothetical protein
MITQKSLAESAYNVLNKTKEAREKNTKDVCDFLLKSFQSYANKGKLECSLSCILKINDKYTLQTKEDDTIDIIAMDEVLEELQAANISVSLTSSPRSNYQHLKASWKTKKST